MKIIESLSPEYKEFFNEPSYYKRWKKLKKIFKTDYESFRVLFMIEILALLDKWEEPSTESLNKLFNHKMESGLVALKIGRIIDIFQAVWPLEMAKFDVLLLNTFCKKYEPKNFFFSYTKIFTSALVHTWWAFETLINDFSGIIYAQRKEKIDFSTSQILDEVQYQLNKKGEIENRIFYQPIHARIQFIYKFLTSESLDRSSKEWQSLMLLKNTRDHYMHRIGKVSDPHTYKIDKELVIKGLQSVQKIISNIFEKTPEFAAKFVYKFLAFWSCETDAPFMWDGKQGNSLYLGLLKFNEKEIIDLYAPLDSSFSKSNISIE
jgi:hypothetical protein